MTSIATIERDLYTDVWTSVEHYRDNSPGAQLADLFEELAGPAYDPKRFYVGRRGMKTVLDAGCGAGAGAAALVARGYDVTLCDLTDAGLTGPDVRRLPFHAVTLWQPLTQTVGWHDYVYCCDVLEHLPPQFTMLAVYHLLRVARHGVFLSVGLQPDVYGLWMGRPLHQTVQDFCWWRDALREIGIVREARDLITTGIFWMGSHD